MTTTFAQSVMLPAPIVTTQSAEVSLHSATIDKISDHIVCALTPILTFTTLSSPMDETSLSTLSVLIARLLDAIIYTLEAWKVEET